MGWISRRSSEEVSKKCLTRVITWVYNRLRQICLLTYRKGKQSADVAQLVEQPFRPHHFRTINKPV